MPDLLLLAELFDHAWVINTVAEYSYVGVFLVLLACGFGLPMPEELPLIGGGYAIYKAGLINPARGGLDDALLMVVVALTGVMVGDLTLYFLGRKLGKHPERAPGIGRHLTPERVKKIRAMFQRHGAKTVFFGRFAFGIRAPVFFLAGSMRVPVRTFLLIDGAAAGVTVPLAVLLAWHFGAQLDEGIEAITQANNWILVVVAILFVLTLFSILRRARAHMLAEADAAGAEEAAEEAAAAGSKAEAGTTAGDA